ncbi:MAG: chemotaxis protein CheB [Synechococcales cyanobacterium C42_A2020_086]|nr:chemotaxis protein CheB [Synechococcales cyanobacterium C42_A2020_086]
MNVQIVVMGASLGGLSALKVLLSGLQPKFPVPIAIAQHRHRDSRSDIIDFLQHYTSLEIREVEDKDSLQPGQVYFAPADYHLLIEPGYLTLSTDAPVSYARPSIDVLFESAAESYREHTVGVILTGANQDGARGAAAIKAQGGTVIVQDPRTAEGTMMPKAAISTTTADQILPLLDIAPYLSALCSLSR